MDWYAFRTAPQKERAVETILNRIGFRAIVPLETKLCRRNRYQRRRPVQYPLMVGYVLCGFSGEPPWYYLFGHLRCLKSVVGFGGRPHVFADNAVRDLLARYGQDVPQASINMRRSFAAGDQVIVVEGPLKGFEGRVEAVTGDRARMVFEMLGGRRQIEVPLQHVEAA